MGKLEILKAITFGQRIAEDEADALAAYFVETEQWRKMLSGDIDVVYGPKGSGKSALYSLLRQKRDDLIARGIIPAAGENIRGTPAFADLVADPPSSEEQFGALWKLYFLSLIGAAFRVLRVENESAEQVQSMLEQAGLVEQGSWSLRRMLRAALEYLRRVEAVGGEIKINPTTSTGRWMKYAQKEAAHA